jgi:uncharacterized protein
LSLQASRRGELELTDGLELSRTEKGTRLAVWAKPRAAKSRVLGVREGALEVAIAAPPVDGAANAELRATLAKVLGLPKRDVVITSGLSGKNKIVELAGVSPEDVRAALAR